MESLDREYSIQQLKRESDKWRGWLDLERKFWSVLLDVPICHSGRSLDCYLMADFLKTLNGTCTYFVIVHQGEHKNDDPDADFKVPHWHLVLKYPRKVRRQTVLSSICKFFDVDPVIMDLGPDSDYLGTMKVNTWVNIQPCTNDIGMIRYLTHRDNPEKMQFDVKNVMTNDRDYLQGCMLLDTGELTGENLINIVCNVCIGEKSRVIKFLGLDKYMRYRGAIDDICKEFNMYRPTLAAKDKRDTSA